MGVFAAWWTGARRTAHNNATIASSYGGDRRPELLKALKHASVDLQKPVKDIVAEAPRAWLDQQENEDDRRVSAERQDHEAVPWEQVKEDMRQARAAQGDRT